MRSFSLAVSNGSAFGIIQTDSGTSPTATPTRRTLTLTSSTIAISGNSATNTVTLNVTSSSIIGGSDTQVQFNDGGSFGGDADFTWNKSTNVLFALNYSSTLSTTSHREHFGRGSSATQDDATSLGYNAAATGADGSTAVGSGATASGSRSVAIGKNTLANALGCIAIGESTTASGGNGNIAIGEGVTVDGSGGGGTSIGYASGCSGDLAFAIGYAASQTADYGGTIGALSSCASDFSFAIGYNSDISTNASGCMVLGNEAQCVGTVSLPNFGGMAAGYQTYVSGSGGTALGYQAKVYSNVGQAMGAGAVVKGLGSVACGAFATSNFDNSAAFVYGAGNWKPSQAVIYARELSIGNQSNYDPVNYTIRVPDVSNGDNERVDIAGSNLIIKSGAGNGTGLGGDISFKAAQPSLTTGYYNNNFGTRQKIFSTGKTVFYGAGAITDMPANFLATIVYDSDPDNYQETEDGGYTYQLYALIGGTYYSAGALYGVGISAASESYHVDLSWDAVIGATDYLLIRTSYFQTIHSTYVGQFTGNVTSYTDDTTVAWSDTTDPSPGEGTSLKEVTVGDSDYSLKITDDHGTKNLGVSSGRYTPTLTAVANVSAATAYECQYMRVGKVVTVSGKLDIDPTTTLLSTQLGISLPIASNIGTAQDCAGTAVAPAIAAMCAAILGDATNDRAQLQYICSDVTNQPMYFTFTYEVI